MSQEWKLNTIILYSNISLLDELSFVVSLTKIKSSNIEGDCSGNTRAPSFTEHQTKIFRFKEDY